MIHLTHTPRFKKRFDFLSEKIKEKVMKRLDIFIRDEYNVILNNHQLHGEYSGCRSINVTGDIRIIYEKIENDRCCLLDIGTHNQLYE